MVVIAIKEINFDEYNKAFYSYFGTFQIKSPLILHISKVWDNPSLIFQPWPPIFLKDNTIQISFIIFSKFHEFGIFKFNYNISNKKSILDTYFETAIVLLQSR